MRGTYCGRRVNHPPAPQLTDDTVGASATPETALASSSCRSIGRGAGALSEGRHRSGVGVPRSARLAGHLADRLDQTARYRTKNQSIAHSADAHLVVRSSEIDIGLSINMGKVRATRWGPSTRTDGPIDTIRALCYKRLQLGARVSDPGDSSRGLGQGTESTIERFGPFR